MRNSLRNRFLAALAMLSLAVGSAKAQMPGMDEAVMKLFGDNKAFTTDAEMSMNGTNGAVLMFMPMNISMLNGQTRTELDLEKGKDTRMPPQALQQMKMLKMTKLVTVLQPDTKTMLVIYTDLASCMETALPKETVDSLTKDPSIVKKKLGSEKVDGHNCTKYDVVVTSTAGQKTEFTLWAATDLNEFPVKLETVTPQGTLNMHYTNTKLEKPDAKKFVAPAGYTKYATLQEFQAAVMQKMAGGAPK